MIPELLSSGIMQQEIEISGIFKKRSHAVPLSKHHIMDECKRLRDKEKLPRIADLRSIWREASDHLYIAVTLPRGGGQSPWHALDMRLGGSKRGLIVVKINVPASIGTRTLAFQQHASAFIEIVT
jgi:hypothetical protein